MEHDSTIKRNETMPFTVTWMDIEIVIQSEISQKEKDNYYIVQLICGIQRNGTYELTCKPEIESQMQKTHLWYQGGEGGWWDELEDWD